MLKLFYITNNPEVALIAEHYGVDRIWIDLETLGKDVRQKGRNSVKSDHRVSDISTIKPLLKKAEMLVRINPWNERSNEEIEAVIEAGADLIMLPMWKTAEETEYFLSAVNGRAKTVLLLETKQAVEVIDEVLEFTFDEIHIGLNDLHLSYGLTFMFELLANGTVDFLCEKFKKRGIPFGFGGIARLGYGMLAAEKVIMEHYRLGSTRAILSRSFCNINHCEDLQEIERLFRENMEPLRAYERKCVNASQEEFIKNRREVQRRVEIIVDMLQSEHNES